MLGRTAYRRALWSSVTACVTAVAVVATVSGPATAAPAPTRSLAPTGSLTRMSAPTTSATSWTEQFDGPAGALPDPSRWRFDVGGGGWGNNESQTYTDRAVNAHLSGQGSLIIDAHGEKYTGKDGITRDYTSARLVSRTSFLYGSISARIRLTGSPGAWPAFWTLGANMAQVGWPQCGELDILEALNDYPTVIGSVHGPQTYGPSWQAYGHGGQTSPVGGLGTGWHTYGVTWSKTAISWLLDGNVYRTFQRADLPKTDIWAMDNPQNLLLNVAVGGWAGTPAAPAAFHATMEVNWVQAQSTQTSS